ncbi:unnamed protein product [Brugia timori]|uniref:Uncharacterized protein n=1 Tax=Brugia timori TaxID=42155 RepID=A0A0R3Q393_9BILA|nr:unnamed protein product [Brugia timori]
MRLFSSIVGCLITVNTYAQFRARITFGKMKLQHLSRYESNECISKQAYYDVENSCIAIVSLDDKCDKVLTNAFEKAIIKPENLKIQVIKNPRDFEYMLRVVQDFCSVTVIQESIKIYVTWFFFDCTKIVGITICAAIGACCYLALRRTNPTQRQKKDSTKEEETSNENVDELSPEANIIKSHSTSTKKTLPEVTIEEVQGKAPDRQVLNVQQQRKRMRKKF